MVFETTKNAIYAYISYITIVFHQNFKVVLLMHIIAVYNTKFPNSSRPFFVKYLYQHQKKNQFELICIK